MTGAFFDAQGCLTDGGLRALATAAAGRAPEDVARHLAACRRCQARALAGHAPGAGKPRASGPSLRARLARAAVAALVVLLLALGGVFALRWLS